MREVFGERNHNKIPSARAIKPTDVGGGTNCHNRNETIANTGDPVTDGYPHCGEGCGDTLKVRVLLGAPIGQKGFHRRKFEPASGSTRDRNGRVVLKKGSSGIEERHTKRQRDFHQNKFELCSKHTRDRNGRVVLKKGSSGTEERHQFY